MSKTSFFEGRRALIVSKHEKEKVIAPLFKEKLGLSTQKSSHFDTDTLGTFTGEVPRTANALITLRKKCELGMKSENYDLAVATEASFGSHPVVFFMPAHEEWMMLKDQKNNM